jgi:hypothetical protein
MRTLAFASAALVTGCMSMSTPESKLSPSEQRAFAAGVARMCDVDRQGGLTTDADPLTLGQRRTAWIADHVESPDVIELRTLMSVKGAADQACMLRDKAAELGVLRCPLADTLAKTGEGGLSP